MSLQGDIFLSVDADLENKKMDTLSANSFYGGGNKITVKNLDILSYAKEKRFSIPLFSEGMNEKTFKEFREAIKYEQEGDIVYSPVYEYKVWYDPKDGRFYFERPDEGFNPSILIAPTAAQIGGYLTLLNNYKAAFRNMDLYMISKKNENLSERGNLKYIGTYEFQNNQTVQKREGKYGFLFPYATFENVKLKGGQNVSNILYGNSFGFESDVKNLSGGWKLIKVLYGGYTGSNQNFKGNTITQNGGNLGIGFMSYKNDFFIGGAYNIGANGVNAKNMYGKENFPMLYTGTGIKAGNNFELKNKEVIIQPNFFIAYSFVNTFDYKNSADIKIKQKPLNAITLAPGIKVIGNLKNGLEPYINVYMVWNLIDKAKFRANDVSLPVLSVKPFVLYGAGIRKVFENDNSAFIQANASSGGRNGVQIMAGVEYLINDIKIEKK